MRAAADGQRRRVAARELEDRRARRARRRAARGGLRQLVQLVRGGGGDDLGGVRQPVAAERLLRLDQQRVEGALRRDRLLLAPHAEVEQHVALPVVHGQRLAHRALVPDVDALVAGSRHAVVARADRAALPRRAGHVVLGALGQALLVGLVGLDLVGLPEVRRLARHVLLLRVGERRRLELHGDRASAAEPRGAHDLVAVGRALVARQRHQELVDLALAREALEDDRLPRLEQPLVDVGAIEVQLGPVGLVGAQVAAAHLEGCHGPGRLLDAVRRVVDVLLVVRRGVLQVHLDVSLAVVVRVLLARLAADEDVDVGVTGGGHWLRSGVGHGRSLAGVGSAGAQLSPRALMLPLGRR